MNDQTHLNTSQDDNELSLWDIVYFLKEGWRWLAGGLVLGLVGAVINLLVTPEQFEAQVLFQGAKVLGTELESSAQLIERLKFPTFYESEQIKACEITAAEPGVALAKSINPSLVKGTNILQVSYRARESEQAVLCLNAVMDRVIRGQNQLSAASLEGAKRQLELTKVQLADAERLQSILEKRSIGSLDAADTKFSQTVLLMSTSMSKKDQIAGLRKSVLDQMANLEPPATRPAEQIAPIYAPKTAVSPKKLPVLAGGLFGGLVLGGLVFFVRRVWLAHKTIVKNASGND